MQFSASTGVLFAFSPDIFSIPQTKRNATDIFDSLHLFLASHGVTTIAHC